MTLESGSGSDQDQGGLKTLSKHPPARIQEKFKTGLAPFLPSTIVKDQVQNFCFSWDTLQRCTCPSQACAADPLPPDSDSDTGLRLPSLVAGHTSPSNFRDLQPLRNTQAHPCSWNLNRLLFAELKVFQFEQSLF